MVPSRPLSSHCAVQIGLLINLILSTLCTAKHIQDEATHAIYKRQSFNNNCIPCQPRFVNPCFVGDPILNQRGTPEFCNWQQISCPSNYFCHVGFNVDTTTCCPIISVDPCTQPQNIGQGAARLIRYYFDAASQRCQQFSYRGTLGNQNNFITESACLATCITFINPCSLGQPLATADGQAQRCTGTGLGQCSLSYWCHIGADVDSTVCCPGAGQQCTASLSAGEGSFQLARWWYDPADQECKAFTYLGYLGNQNSYVTQQLCGQACPVWVNPCKATVSRSQVRSCGPLSLQSCSIGSWCHIGETDSTNVCCPGAVSPTSQKCALVMDEGQGTAALQRWFYDVNARSCRTFYYRGLKGNENNFLTETDCKTSCPTWPDVCPVGAPVLENNEARLCSAGSPCPPQYWCHLGSSQRFTVCCQATGNVCNMPLNIGQGTGQTQRFYYDSLSRTCKSFYYRGIKGNENNFLSEEDCRNTCPVWTNVCPQGEPSIGSNQLPQYCSPSQLCPVNYWCHVGVNREFTMCCPALVANLCQQPLNFGQGNATLPRFAYDARQKQCVPFTYNGIRGNQNNFLSTSDCAATCPVYTNPCQSPEPVLGADARPVKCSGAGTCSGTAFCHLGINPDTVVCCPGPCDPCTQPQLPGEGRSVVQRWYFNSNTGRCENFQYRGSKGNCNNFYTRSDCQRGCQERNPCKPPDSPLISNNQIVSCNPGLSGSCPQTHYCHPGEDSSTTVCCPRRGSACDLPRDPGQGTASLRRWYYSSDQDDCLQFTYSGNAGNENNFLSKGECETACPGLRGLCPHGSPLVVAGEPQSCSIESYCQQNYICHVNTEAAASLCCPDPIYFCYLPLDVGIGTFSTTRYAYYPQNDTCVPFQWSGNGGNMNNFDTIEKCTQICCNDPNNRLGVLGFK